MPTNRYSRSLGRVAVVTLTGIMALAQMSEAQFKDYGTPGLGIGVKVGGLVGGTELDGNVDFQVRGYISHGLTDKFTIEAGGGYAAMSGGADLAVIDPLTGLQSVVRDDYRTDISFADARLYITPVAYKHWSPFAYVGVGALRYDLDQPRISSQRTADTKGIDWATIVPMGVGARIRLTTRIFTDATAGYTWTSTDKLDAVARGDENDIYWGLKLGMELGSDPDPDRDRLYRKAEQRLGTSPRKWDTDGDGLSDREEVKRYKTDPLRPDTDGDGLLDGAEVATHDTDPLNPDSDGDGLADGGEVQIYGTSPVKADSDGDGLTDGEEVLTYKTRPRQQDTDNDGLSDGDEVKKHKTNPLMWDTDGDGISDGAEIARHTNPLVPEPGAVKMAPLTLAPISFAFGKPVLTADAKVALDALVAQLKKRPGVQLEIYGYSNDSSQRGLDLSQQRSEAVREYLRAQGVAADRLKAYGMGAAKLLAPTVTPEGRAMNRRVEFIAKQ